MRFLKPPTIYELKTQGPTNKFRTKVPHSAKNMFPTFEDSLMNREHKKQVMT